MTDYRLYIVFRDSARLESINRLVDMVNVITNDAVSARPMDITQRTLILTGFPDKAVRRRCYHDIHSRYHNMVRSISEVDFKTKKETVNEEG